MANQISGEHDSEPRIASAATLSRHVLVAGIAGACMLGVGAGLWARPAAQDQRHAAPAAKYVAKPVGALQIVVVRDDMAPVPAAQAARTAAPDQAFVTATMAPPPAPVELQPLGPTRPPAGLVRVRDLEAEPVQALPPGKTAEKGKVAKAKLDKPNPEKPRLERAKLDSKARKKPDLETAGANKREKAKDDVQLADSAGDAGTEASDAKRPGRLSRLKQAFTKAGRSKVESDEVKLAKAEVSAEPKVRSRKKSDEIKLARAEAPKDVTARKAAKRCASTDPGAAIVCADPALGAADRQLSRAYREAEAAGVPAWQLKQQQQRWLAARAAAAREAPWAVHDVYLARIAELNDMSRDARTGY